MSSPPTHAHSAPVDFVSSDFDSLASHMQHCARAKGRWFGLRSQLQQAGSLAAGHIVTMACLAVVLVIGLSVVA